jgi:hypothetical protein
MTTLLPHYWVTGVLVNVMQGYLLLGSPSRLHTCTMSMLKNTRHVHEGLSSMKQEHQFAIVPFWAHETLMRHNMPLSEILDFTKVRKVFSASDMASILVLQNHWHRIVGGQQNQFYDYALGSKWSSSAQKEEDREFLNGTVYSLTVDEALRENALNRVFDKDAFRSRDQEAFITYDIAPDVGAIVIYPGRFGVNAQEKVEVRALEALLKALYKYDSYEMVSRTPWFRQYLTGLVE